MDRDPFDLVGDVLDGQFRVDSFAGEGDLSVVYKGHHLGVDATVAIKCLNVPPTLDPSHSAPLVDSFKDASRIHYRLARGNLNIAQCIASGSTVLPAYGTVVPYLVREWFEGESLASELKQRREKKMTGRSVSEALALLEAAFDGVSYAHQQGEVHLSLNPSNLFLASSREGTKLKVLDFGVANAMNDSSHGARRGLRVLFPAYAAPEQLDTTVGAQGPWTDVYALALIVLEVLSDRVVMSEPDPGAIVEHALDDLRRPTPQAHGLKVPRNLELVLTRAVLRAPDRRQKNATELWRDLKSAARPTLSKPNQAAVAVPVPGAPTTLTGMTAVSTTLVPTQGAPAAPPPPNTLAPRAGANAQALAAAQAAARTAALTPAHGPGVGAAPPAPASAPATAPAAPGSAPAAAPVRTPAPGSVPRVSGPAAAPVRTPAPVLASASAAVPAAVPVPVPVPASAPAPAPAAVPAREAVLRPRSPTLVGMAPVSAMVVGAVSGRLKAPSSPSVETQPMSFEPLRDLVKRKGEFEEEEATVRRDIPPMPAMEASPPAPPLANGSGEPHPAPSPPPLPVEAAVVPPVLPADAPAFPPAPAPAVAPDPFASTMAADPAFASAIAASLARAPAIAPAFAPAPAPPLAPAPAAAPAFAPPLAPDSEPALARDSALSRRFVISAAVSSGVAALLLVVVLVTRHRPEKAAPPPPAPVPTAAAPAPEPPAPVATASAAPSAPVPSAAPATPEPEAPPQNLGPFSAKAARQALDATSRDVAKCRHGSKTWGVGAATVTFAPDGTISNIALGAPFRGTPVGECAVTTMSTAHIPPFSSKQGTLVYKFFVAIK